MRCLYCETEVGYACYLFKNANTTFVASNLCQCLRRNSLKYILTQIINIYSWSIETWHAAGGIGCTMWHLCQMAQACTEWHECQVI